MTPSRVFGVTGWKNAGKTTLVERLVAEFVRRGWRVSTIKHAHHDVDVDQPGRDSFRHRVAGATEVAVVGGGNTAVEEAMFLTNFADKVTLVHRRDFLRADKTNQARLNANPKIRVLYDTEIAEVLGSEEPKGVTGVRLRNTVTGSTHEQAVHGLFIAIGHSPATSLFNGQLDMDESGYIKTAPDSTHTSVAGVFAAGDVKDKVFRQAVTAAGMGCMAALEAERFLAGAHSGELSVAV